VPQRVVDFFKAVKVHIEHATAMIGMAHTPAKRQVEPVKKQRTVGSPRQYVVHGVVL
jgi:phage terminase small subunit